MPRGRSGRIVVIVDPDLKRELYRALAGEDRTLKDWFVASAEELISSRAQPSLFQATATESGKKRK